MKMAVVLQVMKLSIIMVALVVVHGSTGENNISPYSAVSPSEERAPPAHSSYHGKSPKIPKSPAPNIKTPTTVPHFPGENNISPYSAVSPSEERAPPAHSSYHGKSPKIPKSPAPNIKTPTTVPHFPGLPVVPPISAPPPSISKKRDRIPVVSPPKETSIRSSPTNHPPKKGSSPILSPAPQEAAMSPNNAPSPLNSPPRTPARKWAHISAPSPLIASRNHHYGGKKASSVPSPSYGQAPLLSPTIPPKKSRQRHHQAPPNQVPTSSFPSTLNKSSPTPSPQTIVSSPRTKRHLLPPTISPSASFPRKPRALLPPPILALPPPPPNQDCTSVTCTEPLVNSPPGSLCGCVWPMQVGLRFSVALYTFFPRVTELAEEIAAGFLMKQSQVRIMGANAAGQKLDETIVLIDLVPLGQNFDYVTAISAYVKLWHKQVYVKPTLFGDYEVLYVRYPGLPPSPPSVSSSITGLGEGLHSTRGDNGRTIHPLGVDVRRKQKGKGGLGGSMIAIIALSSSIAMALCIGAAWVFLKKRGESHGDDTHLTKPTSKDIVPHAKPSGTVKLTIFGSVSGSASPSFDSSIRAYTGSAKTFSAVEIKRATDNFDVSRILGEGGFGLVYRGILGDGSEVAVKVLKRNDQQGDREFLAEVEMLSRLHHRNLVKLIGICTEDRLRCLVYELIPNGSVDSHLHGVEREIAPLNWSTRMKIALGAARGLAYLHEDSNPRVIHRDFKSSNILLEHDCNPKVADFGLARSALEEGSKQHISTRVMGTFGYVAPEYAMTGHLLVKSDVYSYGVVLLELLTGRKPVDMSQPQGQENLVTWARPLLTSKQGLDIIIDPSLGTDFPLDSVAKVAAIASMCVQPEVSNRPFMGEVVQALKLVCDEFEETKGVTESYSQEDLSLLDMDGRISMTGLGSGQHLESSGARYQMDYDSMSVSEVFSTSPRFARQDSGSFRRHSSSGPLRTGRSRQFWDKLRGLSRGSYSEHRFAFRL